MTKCLQESIAHLSAPVANLTKIGFYGGALVASVAVASLLGSSAYAATNLPPLSKNASAKEHVLYTFTGGADDGAEPLGGIIRDSQGNLYGTTYWGGSAGCAYGAGCGTVFKIDKSGTETILYSFSGGADGGIPNEGLTIDSSGNLYGITTFGGNDNPVCTLFSYTGCGVVFELSPSENGAWTETVLHAFSGKKDGWFPNEAGPVLDKAGNLYGAAWFGGDLNCSADPGGGCGVVFKLSPGGDGNWEYTALHRFGKRTNDGLVPAGVALDAQGNLFGITLLGGANNEGTVFSVGTNREEKVLHSFTGGADGGEPYGGVLTVVGSHLYGTTEFGGDLSACDGSGCGVVFEMEKDGTESVLYAFGSNGSTDGAFPESGVVRDASGNLFGMTSEGGSGGDGTVFELTNSEETVLHNFTGGADGEFPMGGMALDRHGNLYGATEQGGDTNCPQQSEYGCGVVFKLKP